MSKPNPLIAARRARVDSVREDPPPAEAQDMLARQLCLWRLDPVVFAVEELRFFPDPWQAEALRMFNDPKLWRIALVACKGPGKSALLAVMIWLFMVVNLDREPKVAVTSITEDNCKDGLWSELRKWYKKSPFLERTFAFGSDRITRKGSDRESCFISMRKWSKKADPEEQEQTLAGLHGLAVMMVLDEAGGVPKAVMGAADGVLTTAGTIDRETGIEQIAKVVIAGNPNLAEGPLWDACNEDADQWTSIRVNGDPDDPLRAPRVGVDWANDQIKKYGRNSPWCQSNVFGQFPTKLTEGVVSVADFQAAIGRTHNYRGVKLSRGKKAIGADIARRGRNRSVFTFLDGDFVEKVEVHHGKGSDEIAELLRAAHNEWGSELTQVDDNGIGGAVSDYLTGDTLAEEDQLQGLARVNSCETSSSDFHLNLRSQLAATLQGKFSRGDISIDPSVRETTLQKEATSIWFVFGAGGKRKLVDKDHFSREKGGSPDCYDSLALAYAFLAGLLGEGSDGDEDDLYRGMSTKATVAEMRERMDEDGESEWVRPRTSVSLRRSA